MYDFSAARAQPLLVTLSVRTDTPTTEGVACKTLQLHVLQTTQMLVMRVFLESLTTGEQKDGSILRSHHQLVAYWARVTFYLM